LLTDDYTDYDPEPPQGSFPLGCECNGDVTTVTLS